MARTFAPSLRLPGRPNCHGELTGAWVLRAGAAGGSLDTVALGVSWALKSLRVGLGEAAERWDDVLFAASRLFWHVHMHPRENKSYVRWPSHRSRTIL